MKKSIKIYIAYQKPSKIFENKVLTPIHVGRKISDKKVKKQLPEIIGDDTGDNISSKNKLYAEATALYWIWKNSTADYVGLFHYRRFLNFKNNDRAFCEQDPSLIGKLGASSKCSIVVEDYDLILPRICELKENNLKEVTIYKHYDFFHEISDLDLALGVLSEKYPHMANFAVDLVQNSTKMYIGNVFIAKKELYNEIMAWLFDILLEVEKRLNMTGYDDYNQKICGFLTERLLHIYFSYLISKKEIKHLELQMATLIPKTEWRGDCK